MRKGQLEGRVLGRQNFPGTLWVQVRRLPQKNMRPQNTCVGPMESNWPPPIPSQQISGVAVALEGTVGQEEVAVGRGVALDAIRALRKGPGVSLTRV